MLDVRQLEITFRVGDTDITAVKDLSLSIKEHEFVAVVGPSGCGKSTMLKAFAGLVPIANGEVTVGHEHGHADGNDLAMVFQEPRLLPWRTVLRNVSYPLEARGVPRAEREERAMAEIGRVGLGGFEHAYPRQLSGGMQQRANLARALVADPSVLLLDEPFAALDAQTRDVMQQQLLDVWSSKRKTAVFVTHQVDEAVYLADRVLLFTRRPGRIKREWAIDLPRPRPLSVKRSAEFHEIEDEIWHEIDRPVG